MRDATGAPVAAGDGDLGQAIQGAVAVFLKVNEEAESKEAIEAASETSTTDCEMAAPIGLPLPPGEDARGAEFQHKIRAFLTGPTDQAGREATASSGADWAAEQQAEIAGEPWLLRALAALSGCLVEPCVGQRQPPLAAARQGP